MKTRFSRRLRWTVLVAATALVAAGCAESKAGDSGGDDGSAIDYTTRVMNTSDDAGDPVQGGTLRVAEYSEARSLDPTVQYPTGSTGGNVMASIYDTLVRYDYETDSFVPQLAESVESSDNKTWTIKLRKGVKFSDGTDLDAKAVIASIDRYKASYALHAMLLNKEIAKMTAVDPLTVEVTMNAPWARFPATLTNGAGMILAPAAYKDPESFKPIGAGPFKLKDYSPAEKTVVVANDGYWNGRPALDSIEFVLLGADRTAYETYQSGGVDVAFINDTQVVDQAISAGDPGMVFYTGMATNLWLNNREGHPTADQRVRRAIALAFDPEVYLDRTSAGAGNPSKLLLGPDSKWSPGVDPMPTDPDEAKKLLEEAKADGFDGKISIIARTDKTSQDGALAFQAMMEAVGFEVELDLVQTVADQTKKIYVDHDFDVAVAGAALQEDVSGRLFSALTTGSSVNPAGYSSKEMDALIAELQTKATPEEAKEVLTKIEELWAEDAPGVAIRAGAQLDVWSEKVHGIAPSGEAIILFDKAWMEK